MEDKRRPHEIEEDAADALALLRNPAWAKMKARLFAQYTSQLLEAPLGTLLATSAHARMVALKEIEDELTSLVTDHEMQVRKPRR